MPRMLSTASVEDDETAKFEYNDDAMSVLAFCVLVVDVDINDYVLFHIPLDEMCLACFQYVCSF